MPFAVKLFSIKIYNSYYKSGICNDLDLIPGPSTKKRMEYASMKLMKRDGMFEVAWLTSGLENPLQVLQDKVGQAKLSFYIKLKNPQVVSFSALNMGAKDGTFYHFHNLHAPPKLHQSDYISELDLASDPALMEFSKMGTPTFGVIHIHLEKLWQGSNASMENWPLEYSLHIKARTSIWRYYIVDKNSRIKMPLAIVLDEDNSYFINKKDLEQDHVYVYESKKPLMLLDKPAQFFSLKGYPPKKSKNAGVTLVAQLPAPRLDRLWSQTEEDQEIFYSDIVVYV